MSTLVRLGRVSRIALQATAALCLTQQVVKADLYGVDAELGTLNRLNTTTGAATSIGSTALNGLRFPGGLAWDGSNMYTIDLTDGDLFTLNLATGAPTLVSTNGLASWQSLAARPSDGTLFLTDNNSQTLYTMDKATGTLTAIGAHNAGLVTALDFNASGELWGVDFFTGRYGTFDTSTGAFTQKGTTQARLQGFAFGEGGVVYVSSTANHNLYTLDLGSGQTTLVGPTGTTFMKAIEYVPNTPAALPEPAELALLGFGVFAAGAVTRLRRSLL